MRYRWLFAIAARALLFLRSSNRFVSGNNGAEARSNRVEARFATRLPRSIDDLKGMICATGHSQTATSGRSKVLSGQLALGELLHCSATRHVCLPPKATSNATYGSPP